ncbi:MAG: hypothetical protein LC118_01460 [Dehalococcoidia bacterium]|nr:hypothetical protein [Dehalococcoidia bacterium]
MCGTNPARTRRLEFGHRTRQAANTNQRSALVRIIDALRAAKFKPFPGKPAHDETFPMQPPCPPFAGFQGARIGILIKSKENLEGFEAGNRFRVPMLGDAVD